MPSLEYNPAKDSLLALVQSAGALLQARTLLIDTLDPYAPLADSALADVLELISGIATELSRGSAQTAGYETPITVTDEPSSFDDAIARLPKFLEEVLVVLQHSSPDGQAMCAVATRAQTFAFFLREHEASRA